MSTYLSEIDRARRKSGDIKIKARDTQTGNGTDTIFQLANKPIINGGWTVKVDSVTKTVSADYNIDTDTGILRMSTAPTSAQTITVEYEHAEANDTQWQEWYNEGIRKMANKFGVNKVFTSASFKTATNQLEYSTSAWNPSVGNLLGLEFQSSTGDETAWKQMYNWKFFDDKIYLAHEYGTGYPMRATYLGSYPTYDATSATVQVQDKFKDLPLYYAMASFMEYKMTKRADYAELPAVERGQAVMSSVQSAAEYWWKKWKDEYNRLRPNTDARFLGNVSSSKYF